MRRSLVFFAATVLGGCFSPEVSEDSAGTTDTDATGASTGGGSETDGDPTGDPTGNPTGNPTGDPTGDPTSTTDDTDTDDTGPQGDDPPNFESFEVNSSTTPEDVTESSLVALSATVSDDLGVANVEFFDGETSLGVVTEEPWELGALVTSSDNGGHVYSAVATDTGGQTAQSQDVQLVSSVDGGELVDVNEGLFEGCTSFGQFGGIAVVTESRLVLAGSRCDSLNFFGDGTPPTVLVADDHLEVVSSTTTEAWLAMPPTTMDDGRVLVPTFELAGGTTTFWDYNVFDPLLGEFEPAAGIQFSMEAIGVRPLALNIPGEGMVLARSTTEIALLEQDLDSSLWTSDLGVGEEAAELQARAIGQDGVFFIGIESDGCPGPSDDCIIKYAADGSREWTRSVQTYLYEAGLASDGRGGVFYGMRTMTGFLVGHLNDSGDEVASELLTFEEPPSSFIRLAADGQHGVVLSFAIGTQDPNSPGEVSGDESILMRLDSSLQELWQISGFGPGQSRGVALANDGRGGLVIAGIRAGADLPNVGGMKGQVWLGRANF